MKHISIFFFFLFVFHSASAQTIVKPEDFPEETSIDGNNFTPTRVGGNNRKILFSTQKVYFTPDIVTTPVGYTPTATGNTLNLMQFVTDPAGDVWYIDAAGAAIKIPQSAGGDPAMGGDLTGTASNAQIATGAVGSNELAATGVTPGTYGSATQVPVVTLDADGRITNVSLVTVSGGGGSNAWGDLTGVPSGFADGVDDEGPTVFYSVDNGATLVPAETPEIGDLLFDLRKGQVGSWNGSNFTTQVLSPISAFSAQLPYQTANADSLIGWDLANYAFAAKTGIAPGANYHVGNPSGMGSTGSYVTVHSVFLNTNASAGANSTATWGDAFVFPDGSPFTSSPIGRNAGRVYVFIPQSFEGGIWKMVSMLEDGGSLAETDSKANWAVKAGTSTSDVIVESAPIDFFKIALSGSEDGLIKMVSVPAGKINMLYSSGKTVNSLDTMYAFGGVHQFYLDSVGANWVPFSPDKYNSANRIGIKTMARLSGQSNATGQAPLDSLSYHYLDTIEWIKICDQYSGAWEDLIIGYNNNSFVNNSGSSPNTYHGAEAGIIFEFAKEFPGDTLYLLKTGWGGSDIDDHLPGGDESPYLQDSTSTQTCLNLLLSRDDVHTVDFRADLWIQGESDATSEAKAYAYQDSLALLIPQKRRQLGAGLPVVLGEVNQSQNGTVERSIINNTLQGFAHQNENVYNLGSANLPTIANGDSHFNSASQIEIGKRFVRMMKGLPSFYITDQIPNQIPEAPGAQWDLQNNFETYADATDTIADYQNCIGRYEVDSLPAGKKLGWTAANFDVSSCNCCSSSNNAGRVLFTVDSVASTTTDITVEFEAYFTADNTSLSANLRHSEYNGSSQGYNSYVFIVNAAGNNVTIGKYDTGNFTQLAQTSLAIDASTTYLFRAIASGTSLDFQQSTDGGTSFSSLISTTDASFPQGSLAFESGILSTFTGAARLDNLKVNY